MAYKHIVFDVDGTLEDNSIICLLGLQKMLLVHRGEDRPLDELVFALGIPSTETMTILGFEDPLEGQRLWHDAIADCDIPPIFSGMLGTLEAIRQGGYHLGVATSRYHSELDQDLAQRGLTGLFEFAVCSDDCETHKPQPGPLLKYMEWAGLSPAELLYIGDSKYDSLCAQAAGVDFALAGWGTLDSSIPAKFHPQAPGDLLPILGL